MSLFFRSQSFDRKDNNSFQDSTCSSNNFYFNNGSNTGKGASRDYLIDHNEVPRLIGKGGLTIKQIQRDNDVQIKVANDRESQWIDLTISGSNDQAINNAFNHIQTVIRNIKEKNESSQSKSFFKPGIFKLFICLFYEFFFIDSNTNNSSTFSFSKPNQNNFRNDNQTYSNNTFSSRGRGYSGLLN